MSEMLLEFVDRSRIGYQARFFAQKASTGSSMFARQKAPSASRRETTVVAAALNPRAACAKSASNIVNEEPGLIAFVAARTVTAIAAALPIDETDELELRRLTDALVASRPTRALKK